MNIYKKVLIALMGISTITMQAVESAQPEVTIQACLFDGQIMSYSRITGGVGTVARAKQFVSGEIFEGSVDAITGDTCTVTVKRMKKGAVYGGEIGTTKMYHVIDQFQITLKKGEPQSVRLSGDQSLELTFEA